MLASIKCTLCGKIEKVNGQKQVSNFVRNHIELHADTITTIQKITCNFIDLNNPEDRITLGIDAKPLVTHGKYNPNDTYLNKL